MKKRNFIIYFLVSVLVVSSCFPIPVYATELDETRVQDTNGDGKITFDEWGEQSLSKFSLGLTMIGAAFGNPLSYVSLANKIAESEAYQNFLAANEPAELVVGYLTDDNFFYFSDGSINMVKNFLEEEHSSSGLTVYPSLNPSKLYWYNLVGANFLDTSFNSFISSPNFSIGMPVSFNGTSYLFTNARNSYYDYVNDGSLVLIAEGSTIHSYYFNGSNYSSVRVSLSTYVTRSELSPSKNGFTSSNWTTDAYAVAPTSSFIGLIGMTSYVFSSMADAYSFYSYNRSLFTGSGNYSFCKLPLDTLNDTDWDAFNSNLYDSVYNAIIDAKDSSDSFTNDDAQAIIDSYMSKVLDTLGAIQEGNLDSNMKLEEILAALTGDGERQSSWLARIHALLEEHLPLIGSGGGSGSGASSDQLEEIINLLEKNVNTLEDIERDTSQIKGLLALDTSMNFFGLLNTKLSQSTDTLKTKFPTSIPWDVVAVVSFMAEEPEAPVFDIPIKVESVGIEENIHIDLSENSKTSNLSSLSKISRTMLTITFIVYLMIFTKNFTGKGD